MPNIGDPIYYRLTPNGGATQYQVVPWQGNYVGSFYTPITADQFKSESGQDPNSYSKDTTLAAKYQANAPTTSSQYYTPQYQASLDASQAGQQNIGTPDKPLYVPVGSAAAQNFQTPNMSTNQSVTPQFKIASVNDNQTQTGTQTETNSMPTVPTAPNFINGLNTAQQQSITNLMNARPSSQWSATDVKNWNYATGGQALPSGYPAITPSDNLTGDSLNKTNPVVVPGAPVGDLSGANGTVAGAQTTLAGIIAQLTPAETPAETQQNNLLQQIASLTQADANKAADQLTAEQSANLPQLKQQFADINAQILSKAAQYNALTTDQEGKAVTMNSIIGSTAQIAKVQAADIGLLQAQAQGLQGQISTAQDTANRAIDLKYSTIEDQIKVYQAQIAAIQPELNKEQAIQAEARQTLLNQQAAAVADQKQTAKDIQSTMIDAVKAGLTDTKVMNAISSANTVAQAQAIAAPYLAKAGSLDLQVKQAQINASNAAAAKDMVTGNGENAIKQEVNKQNALDAQTVNSNYQTIVAIANKVGKTPTTITQADIQKLSNADLTSIGKALGRMQMPDVARTSSATANPLDSVGLLGKIGQGINEQFGQLYSPDKVLAAIQTANSLQAQRQATGLNAETQGQDEVSIGGTNYTVGQVLSNGKINLTVQSNGTLLGSDGNKYDTNGNIIK